MPCKLRTLTLIAQLRITLQAIDQYDHEIAGLATTLPDYALFQPLPGAGPHLIPRLLVAFGEDRERFQSADEVLKYSGIAPVTERSGKKHWVHWRLQCPTFLRQTFIEWAGQTIMWSSAKSPRVPRLSRVLRYDFGLSRLRWNQCPACLGITVQLRLESLSSLRRNSHTG